MLLRNTAFQLIGRGSSLLSGLIAVPIYLQYLGAEAYGVVGVYISLMALSGLFDLGLPISINQKISVMRAAKDPIGEISKVVRSFEAILIVLCCLILAVIYFIAPYIGSLWLNLVSLDAETVIRSLQLAGFAVILRFPTAFYSNCLYAFDFHGRSNAVTTFAAVLRVVLAISAFELYGIGLEVFFWSQIIANGFELLILSIMTWQTDLLFWTKPANKERLAQSLNMVFGLTGISISALFLSQMDKIILSKMVPLDVFGLYSVAYSLAMGLLPIAYSVGNAVFPQLSRMINSNQITELKKAVQHVLNLKCLTVLPIAGVMIFLSDHLVSLLSLFSDREDEILRYLPFLAAGALLQSYTVITHSFKIAQGKPMVLLYINTIGLIIFSIGYVWSAKMWGAYGVSIVFILLNGFILSSQALMACKTQGHGYWGDVIKNTVKNTVIVLSFFYALSFALPYTGSVVFDVFMLSGIVCFVVLISLFIEKRRKVDL